MPVIASLGATYGWRARIGFITPSPGSENNPFEFYLMVPDGVTIVLTSLGVHGLNQQKYDDALAHLEPAVQEMVERKVDAIVQAGVPYVVARGWGYEDELLARVARVTGTPAATDVGACIQAMQTLQMRRVAMLTPFDDKLHEQLTRYVANAGIEVVAARSIATVPHLDVSTIPLAVPYRAAKALYRSADRIDGVWITGALMPTVGIIDQLEQDLGVPVVSSMQAMTWAGLRLAGVTADISGFGRLFTVKQDTSR